MSSAHNLSSVVYRARLTNDTCQVSVHLAHMKSYHQRETLPAARQFEKLADCFLGEPIPLPELGHPDAAQPKFAAYFADKVIDHRCGPCRKLPHNFQYRLRPRGYRPEPDLVCRVDEIPQYHEQVASYRPDKGLRIAPSPPLAPRPPPLGEKKSTSRKGMSVLN